MLLRWFRSIFTVRTKKVKVERAAPVWQGPSYDPVRAAFDAECG